MIYLASPYSHPNRNVQRNRFDAICRVAGEMMRHGDVVFSPIAHSHPIAVLCELPTSWDYWEKVDREYIGRCDEVYVCMMDGWRESKGVAAEIAIAKELGKPVFYIDEELRGYPNPDRPEYGLLYPNAQCH